MGQAENYVVKRPKVVVKRVKIYITAKNGSLVLPFFRVNNLTRFVL